MTEQQLHHMYQAWQQGNEHYRKDWSYFIEYAAKRLNTQADNIMRIVQKCYWFEMQDIDLHQ